MGREKKGEDEGGMEVSGKEDDKLESDRSTRIGRGGMEMR